MNLSSVCHGNLATIPPELVDFARRQVVNALMYKGDERRREARMPMIIPVRMVVVDDDNQPLGEPLQAVTRDVSNSSIGLIHIDPLQGERFAIEMSLAQTDVVMIIALMWTGAMGPFYGTAGRFIEKLDEFPA